MTRKEKPEPLCPEQVGSLIVHVADELLEGLQIIGRDWRYFYINETVARHGRKTKEELLGSTMMECYPGIENSELFAQMKLCMEDGERIRTDNRFEYPDGGFAWFELSIQPVDEGIAILSIDITKRKLAEEKLLEKMDEIERVMKTVVSREVRMAELKDVLAKLREVAPRGGSNIRSSKDGQPLMGQED